MKCILSLVFIVTVFFSCNKADSSKDDNVPPDTNTLPPVETDPANTNYKPAFKGQTRIGGVETMTSYGFDIIAKDLKAPWGIVSLPDGRLLITETSGTMRIVNPVSGTLSEAITGIPSVDDRGQGGLLGLAIAPDFSTSRMVYWVFSEKASNGTHTAVGKGRLANDEKMIENAQVIYRALPTYDGILHYGGRIVFDSNGNLFVSTGERSDKETRPQAQDLKSALGKILHITPNGQAVAGNPFEGQAGKLPEIYSYGHRNPQGLAIHPKTGELWNSEFGPMGGDEINRIKAGANYGWPVITYGLEYSEDPIGNPPIQQKKGMEQPIYYWDPVLSPSGMTFYTGSKMPEWENNLFIGGLSSTHIARIVIKDNKVVGEERLLEREGQRFRDITQGKDGALYAITQAGRLYKIDKK